MKTKLLLGTLLIVIIVLSIYALFIYYHSIPANNIGINHSQSGLEQKKPQKEHSWLQTLLNKTQNYAYPAREMNINIDFKPPGDKTIPTKAVINHLDDYKAFCLNEVLKEEKLEFAYYKSGDFANIVIFLPNDERKTKIMQELKYYEIQYKLQ